MCSHSCSSSLPLPFFLHLPSLHPFPLPASHLSYSIFPPAHQDQVHEIIPSVPPSHIESPSVTIVPHCRSCSFPTPASPSMLLCSSCSLHTILSCLSLDPASSSPTWGSEYFVSYASVYWFLCYADDGISCLVFPHRLARRIMALGYYLGRYMVSSSFP